MAHYFRRVPNFKTSSRLNNKNSNFDTTNVKNLFRRFKLREDIASDFSAFESYSVKGDERPDQVADFFYDDPTLDWVILTTNNIINQTDSWPMANDEFYRYLYDKYDMDIDAIRHYETYEIVDSSETERVVLDGGMIVDENFTFKFYNPTTQSYSELSNEFAARPITNLEYETRLNDEKRSIIILKRIYLDQALLDSIRELRYKKSSDYISNNLKKSANIGLLQ
tara:strand:- start:898 stop:1569 length:672 start_codon:yes stop_codon:yes gene_type:complete